MGRQMTLILSAVKKQFAVVMADGAEFRQFPGMRKFMEVKNRQKLFPLSGRSIVLAVHGQNRLTSVGKKLDSQQLIGDILDDLGKELAQIPSVEAIAQKLIDLLTQDVTHTFRLLQSDGIQQSSVGICVIGFDAEGGRSRGFEAYWPMLIEQSTPYVNKLIHHDNDEVQIIHSGTGGKYSQLVINNVHLPYNPNQLKRASIAKVQKYVRNVFSNASALQPKADPEFGGDCHEVTITQERLKWTIPPA
jgi:hypothetical protein